MIEKFKDLFKRYLKYENITTGDPKVIKTIWPYILVVIGLILALVFGWYLMKFVWWLHTLFYPKHYDQFENLWKGKNMAGIKMLFQSALIAFPLIAGAILSFAVSWFIGIQITPKKYLDNARPSKYITLKELILVRSILILVPIIVLLFLSLIGGITIPIKQ